MNVLMGAKSTKRADAGKKSIFIKTFSILIEGFLS